MPLVTCPFFSVLTCRSLRSLEPLSEKTRENKQKGAKKIFYLFPFLSAEKTEEKDDHLLVLGK